jgi:hypothetical protein
MLSKLNINIALFPATLIVLLAVLIGLTVAFNPQVAIFLSLSPLILWLCLRDKKNALYLFLILMPFISMPVFSSNIMGIVGAKPFNFLAAFTLLMFYFHGGSLLRSSDLIERKSMIFLMIYFLIFSIATFRSLGYLDIMSMISPDNFHNNPLRYLLSEYVRPSLFLIPFIYVLKHFKSEKEISDCVVFIGYSIFLLSIYIIFISIVNFDIVLSGRRGVVEITSTYLGMHYNSVGSIYIIVVPLLVWLMIKRKRFAVINYSLALLAVALLQSRSAFAVFIFGTLLVIFFLRKRSLLILLTSFFALFFLFWLPDFLAKVLSTGMDTGDLDAIFTGRLGSLWLPLLVESFSNPVKLIFGVGRYSMVETFYSRGIIIGTVSAHNAFIEFFVDNGIIIFSIFSTFLLIFLNKAWSWARLLDSPLAWALFICIITYLIGTISGRKIYPDAHNMHLFPIIALYINYIRLKVNNGILK